MATGFLHLHNFLRLVVLVLMVLTLIKALGGLSGNKPFTNSERKTALFLMIGMDVQLLLGLALYFIKGWPSMISESGFMKNPITRYWGMEHGLGMIIAIVLVHIGYAAAKSNKPDVSKYRKLFWMVLIALLVVLAVMPWPFREGIGRGLFPGMAA